MIVPDASAVALIFADEDAEPRTTRAREFLDADPAWVVPEHWRTEVFNVIRGQLRSNLSGYDAAYFAAAEDHDATLVTADLRVARAGLARCPIQVIN